MPTKNFYLNASQHAANQRVDGNSELVYNVRYPFSARRVRIQRAHIPYTFPNFPTSATLTYQWPDAAGAWQTYSWTTSSNPSLPYANLTIEDINKSLQATLISRLHYLIDPNNMAKHFIAIGYTKSRQRATIVTELIPTSLPAGYTKPVGSTWIFPAVARTSIIGLDAQLMNRFGFSYAAIPTVTSATIVSEGDNEANMDPVGIHAIRSNLVESETGNIMGELATFPISGTAFGDVYTYVQNDGGWQDLKGSTVGQIQLRVERLTVPGELVQQYSKQLMIALEFEE